MMEILPQKKNGCLQQPQTPHQLLQPPLSHHNVMIVLPTNINEIQILPFCDLIKQALVVDKKWSGRSNSSSIWGLWLTIHNKLLEKLK